MKQQTQNYLYDITVSAGERMEMVSSIVFNISENASKLKGVADELEQSMNIFKL